MVSAIVTTNHAHFFALFVVLVSPLIVVHEMQTQMFYTCACSIVKHPAISTSTNSIAFDDGGENASCSASVLLNAQQ